MSGAFSHDNVSAAVGVGNVGDERAEIWLGFLYVEGFLLGNAVLPLEVKHLIEAVKAVATIHPPILGMLEDNIELNCLVLLDDFLVHRPYGRELVEVGAHFFVTHFLKLLYGANGHLTESPCMVL